jgi:hypothetical protein
MPGTQLTLSRDEDVHAVVVNNNEVEYQGQVMSLSKAALEALQKLGFTSKDVSGPNYWTYDGRTLNEIRRTKEAGAVEAVHTLIG